MLFTFVTEVSGSTLIEQFVGSSLQQAIAKYRKETQARGRFIDIEIDGRYDPTPITGTRNVWCITGLDPAKDLILTHIILTDHANTRASELEMLGKLSSKKQNDSEDRRTHRAKHRKS